MKRKRRKLFSLVLSIALVVSCMMPVYAEENPNPQKQVSEAENTGGGGGKSV